tara:strand:- start:549 stop:1379 length:831 start_codon:yes stop_codon:yes gene_type:complete
LLCCCVWSPLLTHNRAKNDNALQVYYVTTFVPAIYYNHPLCRLAMLAPLEGGEFYAAFQRITIHVGMDRVLQAYRAMMHQIAAFEHHCIVNTKKGHGKFKISEEIVDTAKIGMKFDISAMHSGSLEGKGSDAAAANAVSWYNTFVARLVGSGSISAGAATTYFTLAANNPMFASGIIAIASGIGAWTIWKKFAAVENPEAYRLTIAAILNESKSAVKKNTEINAKLEVYYRLEQLRYKMNMFSSMLANITAASDKSKDEIIADGLAASNAVESTTP